MYDSIPANANMRRRSRTFLIIRTTVGLFVRKIPHRWNDIFLGFCDGMMLTASLVCLIVPAVSMAGRERL